MRAKIARIWTWMKLTKKNSWPFSATAPPRVTCLRTAFRLISSHHVCIYWIRFQGRLSVQASSRLTVIHVAVIWGLKKNLPTPVTWTIYTLTADSLETDGLTNLMPIADHPVNTGYIVHDFINTTQLKKSHTVKSKPGNSLAWCN